MKRLLSILTLVACGSAVYVNTGLIYDEVVQVNPTQQVTHKVFS